jgi:hypothetical protein
MSDYQVLESETSEERNKLTPAPLTISKSPTKNSSDLQDLDPQDRRGLNPYLMPPFILHNAEDELEPLLPGEKCHQTTVLTSEQRHDKKIWIEKWIDTLMTPEVSSQIKEHLERYGGSLPSTQPQFSNSQKTSERLPEPAIDEMVERFLGDLKNHELFRRGRGSFTPRLANRIRLSFENEVPKASWGRVAMGDEMDRLLTVFLDEWGSFGPELAE